MNGIDNVIVAAVFAAFAINWHKKQFLPTMTVGTTFGTDCLHISRDVSGKMVALSVMIGRWRHNPQLYPGIQD